MNYLRKTAELISLILTLISTNARGLNTVSLKVPPTADIFYPVTLSCEYDLQGVELYSVKWYKDDYEFFRFMPDHDPQMQYFPTPGILLNLENSDMNRVTLVNLQFNTSGNYKCEVSTEAPVFVTVAENSNMTVMAFPTEDPMIEGVMSTYSVGDYLSANCTSGKSYPPAVLSWTLNGRKVESSVWEYPEEANERDDQGLHTKTMGLHFQIQKEHFTNDGGGISPRLEIRCISTVGDSIRHKAIYSTLAKALGSYKLARNGSRNPASFYVISSVNIISMLITSLHVVYSS